MLRICWCFYKRQEIFKFFKTTWLKNEDSSARSFKNEIEWVKWWNESWYLMHWIQDNGWFSWWVAANFEVYWNVLLCIGDFDKAIWNHNQKNNTQNRN